jgi:NTE family protein
MSELLAYIGKTLKLFTCISVLLCTVTNLSAQQIPYRPKVAVVLSGGGAKGFAHVGVLKVLEKEGIPVDIVVGTSIGSIVGAMYAIGYTPEQIEQISKGQDWPRFFSDRVSRRYLSPNEQLLRQRYVISIPFDEKILLNIPSGVIRGQNILNYFCGLTGNVPENADFSKFPKSFACVSTNLETGEKVVIKDGFLPTAIYASMAIPGVFAPCERESKMLVDGGMVDNFPYDVARSMGADVIIGVDIRSGLATQDKLHSLPNLINQLISLFDPVQDSINKKQCNILIRPDIKGYTSSSFTGNAVDSLILRGERAATEMLLEIRELKKTFNLPTAQTPSLTYTMPEKWLITDIKMLGNFSLDKKVIQKALQLVTPGQYSYQQIKEAIDKVYGQESFEKVYFGLQDDNTPKKGKILKLYLYEKKDYTQNIGFKVNTTDAAAILLNINRKDYTKHFDLLSASVELSASPGFSLLGEIYNKRFLAMGLKLEGKKQDYSIYLNGEKSSSADLYYGSASLYFYQHFFYLYNTGIGYRQEYYTGDIYYHNQADSVMAEENKNLVGNAYAYVSFDNFDDFYFPQKGVSLYTEFSLLKDYLKKKNGLCPVLLFKMRNVIPITRKTAFLFNIYSRAIYNVNYSQFKNTFIGGEDFSTYFPNHIPFVGLSPVMPVDRYADILFGGLRYRVARKHYVTLMANVLKQSNAYMDFKNYELIFGGGVCYSIKTNMGPLDVTFGFSNYTHDVTFSANLGYWF